MADPVIMALTTTLQTEITAGQALPQDIVALSSGIAAQATIYSASVQSRRVGLLGGINVLSGEDVSKVAMRFNECIAADGFARSAISADSDLGQLRAAIPGLSTAKMNAIATGVMTRAAAYQAEFVATLPS